MQHDGSKETVEKEIFAETSSDEEDEMMVEDAMEVTEERTGKIQFISEFPPNIGEDCWEDGLLIHLYVYGVRHPHLGCFEQIIFLMELILFVVRSYKLAYLHSFIWFIGYEICMSWELMTGKVLCTCVFLTCTI